MHSICCRFGHAGRGLMEQANAIHVCVFEQHVLGSRTK